VVVSEAELQKAVIALAQRLQWRVAHFRPGLTKAGNWVTAVQGDGKGFPDLVLARPGRLLFVELKAQGKYPSPEQREWLEALGAAGTEWRVWRPRDWHDGTIERELRPYREAAA
jgi:hypothetical protein